MTRYIDADVLFDAYEKTGWYNNADRDEIAERLLLEQPTIEAEPVRHGKWIESDEYDEFYGRLYRCSNCNTFVISDFDNYCPNCGADMRTEND